MASPRVLRLLLALGVVTCAPAQPPPPPPPPPPSAPVTPLAGQPLAPAQPVPYAPPCHRPEGTCGWARCNLAAGRCLWPCQGDGDCVSGARCLGPPGLAQCVGAGLPPAR